MSRYITDNLEISSEEQKILIKKIVAKKILMKNQLSIMIVFFQRAILKMYFLRERFYKNLSCLLIEMAAD